MDTSGFYLVENNNLLYAQNFIKNSSFEINRNEKDSYTYPINGWYWFDSEEDARIFFNLPIINTDESNQFLL